MAGMCVCTIPLKKIFELSQCFRTQTDVRTPPAERYAETYILSPLYTVYTISCRNRTTPPSGVRAFRLETAVRHYYYFRE